MGNFTINGTWWVFIWEIPLYMELAFFPIENGCFYQWEKTSAKVREFPARHLASCQRSEHFPRISDIKSHNQQISPFFSRLALLGLPQVDLRLKTARTTLTSPVRRCIWPLPAKPPWFWCEIFREQNRHQKFQRSPFSHRYLHVFICVYIYIYIYIYILHFY